MSDDLKLMNKWRGRLDEWPRHALEYVNELAKTKKQLFNKKQQEEETCKKMPHAIFGGQCKVFHFFLWVSISIYKVQITASSCPKIPQSL